MPASDRERDLKTLRNLIDEAHAVLTTVGREGRGERRRKDAFLCTMQAGITDRVWDIAELLTER